MVKHFYFIFLLSAFLLNCFLCWDRWNGDMTSSLDAAMLCSSKAGTDLGCESGLVWGDIGIIAILKHIGRANSVYAQFDIVSNTCHPAPCYLNSNKAFLLLSDPNHNPELGFEPRSLSECLLEFDTSSKSLGHHGLYGKTYFSLKNIKTVLVKVLYSGDLNNKLVQYSNGSNLFDPWMYCYSSHGLKNELF